MRKVAAIALFLGSVMVAGPAQASPISIYTAPDQTYQNGLNNPCVFYGPGACNGADPNWSFVGNTGNPNPYTPYPLTITYGDDPGELALFGQYVGREFLLGLDMNEVPNLPQTLDNLTINFFDVNGVNIGGYAFAPAVSAPANSNGGGWADYVLSAGCLGTVGGGAGVLATCTNYAPFIAPAATRQVTFTFGLNPSSPGADTLFLISAGRNGVPTPFGEVPTTPAPEPASLFLLGSGLLGVVRTMRKHKAVV
jgi:hypothetical protein